MNKREAKAPACRAAMLEAVRHFGTAVGPAQTARYCDAIKDGITILFPWRDELGDDTRRLVANTIRAMSMLLPLCERPLWFHIMVYDPWVIPLTARLNALAAQTDC